MPTLFKLFGLATLLLACAPHAGAQRTDVYLLDVPDYDWAYGCFGTATGNLAGYWDRNGLPDFYTGPTGGGLAPLNSSGGNAGIQSLWASQAGVDGRPANRPGHVDDYWIDYDSPLADPYVTAGRAEHTPDCLGDFIGLNQKRWTRMNGECDGNVDGFSFTYWDTNGTRRVNFVPSFAAGKPARDIPSGLQAWARVRRYDAAVFSQLTDFNTTLPAGTGFTYEDLKVEINAGYPVLLFLQDFASYSRAVGNMSQANPEIHGMLAYGYQEDPAYGVRWVYYRTSWASGGLVHSQWDANVWQAGMPVRGVIGFHPRPKLRSISRAAGLVTLAWDGPSARLYDTVARTTNYVNSYQAEWTPGLNPANWQTVGAAVATNRVATFPAPASGTAFYRVRLLGQ